MPVQLGHSLSHYRILHEIGKGGMGVVFKAHDTHLDRDVAVKILPEGTFTDDSARRQFRKEALALSKLNHPNVQTVHDFDTQEDIDFLVTEYVPGVTLKEKLVSGFLSEKEISRLGVQLAEGLSAAHAEGVVHRDLKPDNLKVTPTNLLKILDFGLAKFTQPVSDMASTQTFTQTKDVVGTLPYMAPEILRGKKGDRRIDIYAVGVLLYEMATGHRPFDQKLATAMIADVQTKLPPSPARYNPGLSSRLEDIILKCLEKDPDNRYQSAKELLVDLRRLSLPSPSVPTPTPPVPRSWMIGGVLALAAITALLLSPGVRDFVKNLIPGSVPSARGVVVLPFENVGGDPDNQAYCDGLMETVSSRLTQLEQFNESLWVIPASAVREAGVTGPLEARRKFGVDLIVTGSTHRLSDGFRQTLNLIQVDGKAPRQLRSAMIDYREADKSVENETFTQLVAMLNLELAPEAQARLVASGTDVTTAYDFYVQALGHLHHYEKTDNIDKAIALFDLAIGQDSLYAQAYAGLGEAYFRKYNASLDVQWIDHAVRNCQRAAEINDSIAPVHNTLGRIYKRKGMGGTAILEFQRALAIDPASAAAHRGLASVYADLGRLEEAETTYQAAIEMKPGYWAGYNDLGRFYYDQGRYDDAITQFREVLRLTPDNYPMWYNRMGATFYQQGNWPEARKMFERSIAVEPTYRAYSNLGVVNYIEGRYAESAAMCEKALELSDTSYITWAQLANAYYWMPGKRDQAVEVFRRVVAMAEEQREVNPRDADLLSSLAGYYVMVGDDDGAMELIRESLEIAPNDMWVIYAAGYNYEQLGDRDKALELIGKALEMGYPLKEVERDPWLRDLREDERFQKLLQG